MSALARAVMTAGITAALMGGALTPTAAAQAGIAKDSKHTYTCTNKGGGPDHTVNCSGLITVNNVLNNTTVTMGDINFLNDNQLKELQVTLAGVSDIMVNQDVTLQLLSLERTVARTYLLDVSKVRVCALSICV